MSTSVTNNSKVKFVYVPTGKSMPVSPDGDTVYFVESSQQLYVGDHLIADAAGASGYKVKDVTITGSGDNVSNIEFNSSTGMITVTKSNLPTLAKGTDTSGTPTTLTLGGTFAAMTDTAVNGHTITDENTTFTMPNALTNAVLANDGTGKVKLTATSSDNSVTHTDSVTLYTAGSVASGDTGLVTGGDVYTAIENATAGLSGAMHFLGMTSTAVTDGGQEQPTIGGSAVPLADLKAGDVVIYQPAGTPGTEYVWDTDGATGHWRKLGDDSSFALKTVTVTGTNGLTGGGDLSQNRTISHGAAPSSGSDATATAGTAPTTLVAVTGVTVDTYGHVAGVTTGDFATKVGSTIDDKINALDVTAISGDYITAVSETDGKISATTGTKGAVASADTGLVDGGTVYTAIDAATTKWTVVS